MNAVVFLVRQFGLQVPCADIERLCWIAPARNIFVGQFKLPSTLTRLERKEKNAYDERKELSTYSNAVVAVMVNFQMRIDGGSFRSISGELEFALAVRVALIQFVVRIRPSNFSFE